jgi:L-threonylcarbamoyladenylate synthase
MSAAKISVLDAERLQECVSGGGVAVFPTDTVYGICCDPDDEIAARRLYELKGYPPARSPARPAAVMFFALEFALAALGAQLDSVERAALETLLPGPVTLLLPNRAARFVVACGPDPATIGLRVPRLPNALATLQTVRLPVMQSSANLYGQADARTLSAVPSEMLAGADLALDGGELPGVPSTVIDLREYASSGGWRVLREGSLPALAVESLLTEGRIA